jgi:hypothetical protein
MSREGSLEFVRGLHERLDRHFQDLRTQRNQHGGGKPIFALEHGLNGEERTELEVNVRELIKNGQPVGRSWLPLVLYSAEIGYRYAGEEYWQTFETETPGWTVFGERDYVRETFRMFATRFGGAQPSGRWADQFSIISWPITHAVLPTDLQFHLSRILYDYRHQLTQELLAEPELFGAKLAARTAGTSSRFVNFSQNTDLLGQVAAALLIGTDDESQLLLSSTLERIVADLDKVRKAKIWLREARASVIHNRVKGLRRDKSPAASAGSLANDRTPQLGPPSLSLTRDEDGEWRVSIDLPDFETLRQASPELHAALGSLRCRIAGIDGPPIARGRVLFEPHMVLDRWPTSRDVLLQLENGDAALNRALGDECHLPPGPPWVFRLNELQTGIEVIGKTVRPGGRYMLLTDVDLPSHSTEWISASPLRCPGVMAYDVQVPTSVGAAELGTLRALGVSVVIDIEIRPAGIVAAAWDGEGRAEWIAGDRPVVAISSNREIQRCTVALDNDAPVELAWPTTEPRKLYIRLTELDVGQHMVRASLLPAGGIGVVNGNLAIEIREPRVRAHTGSFREALVMLCSPASPTLEELWEGKASISVIGPAGVPVLVTASLEDRPGRLLISRQLRGLSLPIEPGAFAAAFDDQFRSVEPPRVYDEATACAIAVTNPDLGSISLRCEREFAPLRWGIGRDHDGPYARLHDNVGARNLKVERFTYSRPDVREPIQVDIESMLRSKEGGLFSATSNEFRAAVLLPPFVHDFNSIRLAAVRPWITASPRSLNTILNWLELSGLWTSARLPGDPFARHARDNVLRAFAASISSVIGGGRWAAGEQRIASGGQPALVELAKAIGVTAYEGIIAGDVKRRAPDFVSLPLDARVRECASYLRRIAPNLRSDVPREWHAEFMLRLASTPGQALAWAGQWSYVGIDMALQHAMMLRVARYIVLAVHYAVDRPSGASPYEGWAWD